MKPPFKITPALLNLCTEIAVLTGQLAGLPNSKPTPQLRRQNRIRTIQASLEIEGNTLDVNQITAIIEGKRVLAPAKDILEVTNAIQVYDRLASYNPYKESALLKAHAELMKGLINDAGHYRTNNVGVFKGEKVAHMAPKARLVPKLMSDLFVFLQKETTHPLILACVFHYELEFIHPFADGNGRMGRLWQTLLLRKFHPLFEFIPVESLIRERQKFYYQALGKADQSGDSTIFVEFSLITLRDALTEFNNSFRSAPQTDKERLEIARDFFKKKSFSRKNYLNLFKSISSATASRDLAEGVAQKILKRSGDKALARYQFKN